MAFLILWVAHRVPQHWLEEIKLLVVHLPWHFLILRHPLCLSLNSDYVSSFHLVRQSSLPEPFPSLTSWLMRLATFLYETERAYGECYCWLLGIGENYKALGVATAALHRSQDDRVKQWARLLQLSLIHGSSASPGVWHLGKTGQMQHAGTRGIQSLIPSDATVWSIQEDTLGAMLYHLDISCWSKLLCIWPKAATLLPHQSELKDQSWSSSCNLPKPLPSYLWSWSESRA